MHKQYKAADCGKIDAEFGIYLVEAMRWAINQINVNNNTKAGLRGLTLGYRIRDTCHSTGLPFRFHLLHMSIVNRMMGIVGPVTSDQAILASAGLVMPIISYSATSMELNNREKYFNFFRTIPSDNMQVRVLLDILRHYNWKYISTVNSHGTYGQQGIQLLIKMISKVGICIASRNSIPKSPKASDFEAVIKELEKDSNARTVILFTTAGDTRGLLTAARSKTKFQWVSSSSWDPNNHAVQGIKDVAKGAILLNYANINNETFMNYFMGLKLNDNRYRWFEEFWEQQFNCSVGRSKNSTRNVCTGNESLHDSQFYAKYAASNAVIDAVFAYSDLLKCAINALCKKYNKTGNMKGECDARKFRPNEIKIGMILDLMHYRCKEHFDRKGNTYRDFEIINFDGEKFNTVGVWKLNPGKRNGTLKMNTKSIVWYNGNATVPESICSKPCKVWQREIPSKTKMCCFACKDCAAHEIVKNNTCIACDKYSRPNRDRSECKSLVKFPNPTEHPVSTVILAESSLGFILNTIVLIIFVKYYNSKVIKASSRELSFFMLGGLYLCFLSPCVFLLDPSKVRCGLRRFIFGMSLTACYTPLMLKTNRIYRIFNAARNPRTIVSMPQFVSPASQILICFGLLSLQLLLCIMWVVGAPPKVVRDIVKESDMVAHLCGANLFTIAVNLVPCFCMLAVSTVYAFKSRKFPKNFNEASNIGITMYVSCALWAIFVPSLMWVKISTGNPFGQIFVIANFSNVIGLVSLLGLFGPKLRQLMRYEGNRSQMDLDRSNDRIYGETGGKKLNLNILGSIEDFIVDSEIEMEEKKGTAPANGSLRNRRKSL